MRLENPPMPGRREPPKDIFPSDEEIAELCYAMLLEPGADGQRMTDYWRLAESHLLEKAADRALRVYRSRGRS